MSRPTAGRREAGKVIAAFCSSNVVASVLSLAGAVVQARYVEPGEQGLLRTVTVISGYMTFLHFGVFDGLRRQVAVHAGAGTQADAERSASASLLYILALCIAGVVLFGGLAAAAGATGDWPKCVAMLAGVPVIAVVFYGGYLTATYRTGRDFMALSKIAMAQSLASTLVLPLLPALRFYGACIRLAVGSGVSLYLTHRYRPLHVSWSVDWPAFRKVVRIGLPMSAIGYLATSLWVSLEGSFLLGLYGADALGLFTLAEACRMLGKQLYGSVNNVLYARACERFGRTQRVGRSFEVAIAPIAGGIGASIPLVLVGWFVVPFVILHLVPKYAAAATMVRYMLLSLPIGFLGFARDVLQLTLNLKESLLCTLVGLGVFVMSVFILHERAMGPESVVVASLTGQVASGVIAHLFVWRLSVKEQEVLAVG